MYIGTGTSKGIGMGHALLIENATQEKTFNECISDPQNQIQRYHDAKEVFISEIENMISDLKGRLKQKDDAALVLKNQIYLINDAELNSNVENIINSSKLSAEAAVTQTCDMYIQIFKKMDNEMLKQRVADIEDLKNHMLNILMDVKDVDLSCIKPGTIIVAKELHPSQTAIMNTDNIAGIIAEKGGDTSHASILARALQIPAVLSVKDVCSKVRNGDYVIVDGEYGEVFINPIPKTIQIYEKKKKLFLKKIKELDKFINKETITKDGKKVCLAANIASEEDAIKAMGAGAEGVGLFRTEFLFMNRTAMPDEKEQFEVYKKVAVICKNKTVTIRTLDIGGDKDIPYMGLTKESNPFLGYRAIRFCLGRVDIFKVQLRAILRASAYGNLRIMLPLITSVSEVTAARKIINDIMKELDAKKIKYDKNIKMGIMVETPAASLMADVLAKQADFFSIGTNDLTQYTMSVDRGNENVAYLYSVYNPAVLRSIRHIIKCAKDAGIEVGMCGEAASMQGMVPLLLSFGLDEFSVSSSKTLETRKNIASWTMKEAKEIEDRVMQMCTQKEVAAYLNDYMASRE